MTYSQVEVEEKERPPFLEAAGYFIFWRPFGTGELLECYDALVSAFEQGGAYEVFVDFAGAFAAFADGPDDEGLSAAHITGCEDLGDIGHVVPFGGLYVASVVEFHVEFFE